MIPKLLHPIFLLVLCSVFTATDARAQECKDNSQTKVFGTMAGGPCEPDTGKNLKRVKEQLEKRCQGYDGACKDSPSCKWKDTYDANNIKSGLGCDPNAFKSLKKGSAVKFPGGLEYKCLDDKGCCSFYCPENFNECAPCSGGSSSSGSSNSSRSSSNR